MKYIIDSDDVIGYTPKYAMLFGDGYMIQPLEDLEELNSDYINEHFGDLQDTAYQRGLEDAWEAARKVGHCKLWDDYTKDTGKPSVCAVAVLDRYTAYEAIEKLKAYEKKQSDKIEVGDIVERYLNGKLDSTGIYLGEDGDYWNCLFWTGAIFGTFAYPKNQFKKTGRHVDIDKILEDMRND